MTLYHSWTNAKERLNNLIHNPPFVTEGDIWWTSIGQNIGSEIHGKSRIFSRPVIILKKLSHGFYFAIPTTTQTRDGSWYVPFNQKGKQMRACLHQARSLDYRRLSSKIGSLDDMDLSRVRAGFSSLYLK